MNYDGEGNEDAFMDVALYRGVQWAFWYEDMVSAVGWSSDLWYPFCDHYRSGNSRNAFADIWLSFR